VCAGYYWDEQQITDESDSELDYLDELVQEHEEGIADNRKRLKWLIQLIENNYDLSPGRVAHLGRIRRMLDDAAQELSENKNGKLEQRESPFGQS
jgi:chemotaxis regulatin CheY-phosphate phosphatase CheZ